MSLTISPNFSFLAAAHNKLQTTVYHIVYTFNFLLNSIIRQSVQNIFPMEEKSLIAHSRVFLPKIWESFSPGMLRKIVSRYRFSGSCHSQRLALECKRLFTTSASFRVEDKLKETYKSSTTFSDQSNAGYGKQEKWIID